MTNTNQEKIINIEELRKLTKDSKDIVDIHRTLFENGHYNKVFENIGLSNEYEEDDLDILDDYFRNKRDLKESIYEALSRLIFAIYLAKIVEKNNDNVEIMYEKTNNLDQCVKIVIRTKYQHVLLPMVKLGKVAFDKQDDLDLSKWYQMNIIASKMIKM